MTAVFSLQSFDSKLFLKGLMHAPGIYQMINAEGVVLYVGKARNLKKRVASYFRQQLSLKTAQLMANVHHIDVIVTQTENEALLLESNLIKKLKPRYNILLRDDKSYPYILLSDHLDFPRLSFYRGIKRGGGRYFGPYPSSLAVRETLNLLQKLFRIRSCEESFFRNRTRPCMQYQIQRCTAPCVAYIDPDRYQENVRHAVLFLEGKNQTIIDEFLQKMDAASIALQFEKAVLYRDQIAKLRQIQQQQTVVTDSGDVDVIALAVLHGKTTIQVLTIRTGNLLGSKAYFPLVPPNSSEAEILAAFLPQYYLLENGERKIPKQIILSHTIEEENWLKTALMERTSYRISFITKPRGQRAKWLLMALQNAKQSLVTHLASRATVYQRLEALQLLLMLDSLPQRLECFDISHSQGEATVASCVVFDIEGPRKSDYRRFNIENVTSGDDYAAMRQALFRRYSAVKTTEAPLPDVLLIDGGKGQLKQAESVLEELQISGVTLLAVAKGPTRKPGMESLLLSGHPVPLQASSDSIALHLIQQIRDEAHRFAITGHRGRRAKARHTSVLEIIPGIGAKRRRELLRQFGGMQELKRASIDELAKVPGVSLQLAERIYFALQAEG